MKKYLYGLLLICSASQVFANDPEMPKGGIVLLQITEKREDLSMDRGWKAKVIALNTNEVAEECYLVPEVSSEIEIFNIVNCVDFKIGDFVYSKSLFTGAISACAQALKEGKCLSYHGAFKVVKGKNIVALKLNDDINSLANK